MTVKRSNLRIELNLQIFGGRGSSGSRGGGKSGGGGGKTFTTLTSDEENAVFFDDMEREFDRELTTNEKAALSGYTMYDSDVINAGLRADNLDPDYDKTVDRLDSAIGKFDLTDNVTVYRAGGSDIAVDFKAYASTSTSRAKAEEYLNNNTDTLYEIKLSKGHGKGAYIAKYSEVPEEHEFLLKRGSKPTVSGSRTEKINGKSRKVVTLHL